MKATVIVKLKEGVLDPQGQAIQRSLNKMGHPEVIGVRQGKYFEIEFQGDDREALRRLTEEIAEEILSNPIIEKFEVREIS